MDLTNQGYIGVNKFKKAENHPDYTGKLNIEGKEYKVAGWKKAGKDGSTFLSLRIKSAEEAEQKPTQVKKTHYDNPF